MAKNRITEEKLVEKEIYNIGPNYAKSLQPAIDANEKFLQSFKANAQGYAQISKEFKKATTDNKKFLQLKKEEERLRKEVANALKAEEAAKAAALRTQKTAVGLEKSQLDLEAKKERQAQRSKKLTIEERVEQQHLNKIKREQAKITLGLVGPYDKLSKELNEARKRAKDLGVQFGMNSKQFKTAQREVNALDGRLKKLDTALGQSQRYVGNYERSLRGLRGIFLQLTSALGLMGGAFAFVQVFRNGIKIIRDFEKANATLSGVLQVEKDQMQGLIDDAKRLGETTVKSANQVTQLQIAFARLGFSQQQIIDMTEPTIAGSIAMNAELDQTANLVGAVVNTFDDLSSTDAPEILDVLSLSTAKSALNFEKLETALPIVAGAANAAQIPFTKLVALLGKLSDAGIDTSSSATSLRNIFIESAAQGLDYEQILEKIVESQDKLTEANDEFGKRAAVSASVLANNISQTNELDTSLQNAAGTAQKMANKELDTLDGALQLLKSAWEGVVLETDEANGITNKLKSSIQFLAINLKSIVTVLIRLAGIWLTYKATLLATSVATRAYAAITTALRIAKVALARGITSATTAMKLFNTASKANIIGALASVVMAGVAAFIAFKDGVKDTVKELKELKKAAQEARDETVDLNIANVKERLAQIDASVKNEKEALRQKENLIKDEIKQRTEATKDIDELLKDSSDEAVKAEEEKNKKLEELQTKLQNFKINKIKKGVQDERALITESTQNLPEPQEQEVLRTGFMLDQNEREKTVQELEKLLADLQKQRVKSEEDTQKKISEKARKAAEERRKKQAKDAYELEKFILEQRILAQEQTVEDSKELWFNRYTALDNQYKLEEQLAKLNAERKFELTETFSKEELNYFKQNGRLRADQVKQLTDEELLIYKQYLADLKTLQQQGAEGEAGLDVERMERQAERIKNIREKEMEEELQRENDLFQQKQGDYANELTAVENLEKRKAEIKKQYAIAGYQAQVEQIEKLLKSEDLSADERARYERELAGIKRQISDLTTEDFIEDNQEQIEATRRKVETIASIEQQLSSTLRAVSDAVYGTRIDRIQEEIDANNEKYEQWLENENLTTEQKEEIEAQRREKEKELEKKQREEQRKQAVLDKAMTAAQISIQTALAVTKALASAPPPVNFALAATVGALGAIELAAVLATPIPKYAKGTEDHPGGWAEVAEERPEVIEEPGKAPYIQKQRAILNLPKHTKVTPSVEEYEKLKRASILSSVAIDNKKLNDFQSKQSFNDNKELINKLDSVEKTIAKSKAKVTVNPSKSPDINHELFRFKNTNWNG